MKSSFAFSTLLLIATSLSAYQPFAAASPIQKVTSKSQGSHGDAGPAEREAEAKAAYAQGHALAAEQKYAEAIPFFQKAVRLKHDYYIAREWLAVSHLFLKRYEEAIENYTKLIEQQPAYSSAYPSLAYVYIELGQFELAADTCRKIIAINPTYAPAHENLGVALIKAKKFEEAVVALNQALKLAPSFSTYSNLCATYDELAQYENAISAGLAALRLKPDDTFSLNNLAHAYLKVARYDEAARMLNEAIRLDPEGVTPYVNLGDLYLRTHDYDKALDIYRRAIAVNPPYLFDYYLGLSRAYAGLNRDVESMDALHQGINLDPNGAAKFHRHLVEDEPERWLEEFRKASVSGDEMMGGLNDLGVAYLHLKRYPEAIKIFERVLRLDPANAPAYSNLGDIYFQQDEMNKAIEYFGRAIKLKPNFPLPYNNLAQVYFTLKRYDEALKISRQALALRSDYAPAHYTLGLIFLRLGNRAAAINEHRQLLTLNPKLADNLYEIISRYLVAHRRTIPVDRLPAPTAKHLLFFAVE